MAKSVFVLISRRSHLLFAFALPIFGATPTLIIHFLPRAWAAAAPSLRLSTTARLFGRRSTAIAPRIWPVSTATSLPASASRPYLS